MMYEILRGILAVGILTAFATIVLFISLRCVDSITFKKD